MGRVAVASVVLILGLAGAVAFWPDRAAPPGPQRISAAPTPSPTGPLRRGAVRSHAVIRVRRDDRTYELRGSLDLTEGYRFRGRVTVSQTAYVKRGTPVWLAGGKGTLWGAARTVDTLTRPTFGGRRRPIWLDDHPPTLPLANYSYAGEGAEVYAHLALKALKHGRHGEAFDFSTRVGDRRGYDELRRAELAAGPTALDTETAAGGRLERLRLTLGPAAVDLRLYPSDRAVPPLDPRAFAME